MVEFGSEMQISSEIQLSEAHYHVGSKLSGSVCSRVVMLALS